MHKVPNKQTIREGKNGCGAKGGERVRDEAEEVGRVGSGGHVDLAKGLAFIQEQ